jgi:hypothetical protein
MVLESGKSKYMILACREDFLLHHNTVESILWQDSKCASLGLSSSSKATNAIAGTPSSVPHLTLMTSQRPTLTCHQHMNLGIKFLTHELLGNTFRQNQPEKTRVNVLGKASSVSQDAQL